MFFSLLLATSTAHTAALFAALAVHGLAAGLETPHEMGYWQAATPDGLLGRVNATRRSANRTVAAVGSVLGGALLGIAGDRVTLIGIAVVFAIAAAVAALSPLRTPAGAQAPAAAEHGRSPD